MALIRILALGLISILSSTAMADAIDVNLRDTSAQIQYFSSSGRESLGKTQFHIGFLYASKNNTLTDFGMMVKDEVGGGFPGFSVGIGIKGLVAQSAGNNISAIALGAMMRYSPPDLHRMGIVGQLYFSPNVTTFGSADRYTDAQMRLEYDVIPNAAAYIGYRNVRFSQNAAPGATLDEGFNVGVRMSF